MLLEARGDTKSLAHQHSGGEYYVKHQLLTADVVMPTEIMSKDLVRINSD